MPFIISTFNWLNSTNISSTSYEIQLEIVIQQLTITKQLKNIQIEHPTTF